MARGIPVPRLVSITSAFQIDQVPLYSAGEARFGDDKSDRLKKPFLLIAYPVSVKIW